MADQLQLDPDPTLTVLRERLEDEGTVVLNNGSELHLLKDTVTVLSGRIRVKIECSFGIRRLDDALAYAQKGPKTMRRPRRYPGRPACYRPPEVLAKELRGFHKLGVLTDVPEPEFEEPTPEPHAVPRDQPF